MGKTIISIDTSKNYVRCLVSGILSRRVLFHGICQEGNRMHHMEVHRMLAIKPIETSKRGDITGTWTHLAKFIIYLKHEIEL